MPWSVFLLEEVLPLAAGKIGRLVQQAAGGVALDHAQRVKLHYGWVAQGLGEGQADALVALLGSSGLPALKKDEGRLVKLEKKFKVHRALLLEDALHLPVGLTTEFQSTPWQGISVVSLGNVVSRSVKGVAAPPGKSAAAWGVGLLGATVLTGIPLPLFHHPPQVKRQALEEVVEEAILIHLIFARPPFVVEIRPREFDYGYLGERLAGTSRENFVLLLEDLARLAAGAHWTRISRTFLETGKLAPDFKDDHDFLRFNQWITEVAEN
jgi:hypothetical protein